MKNKQIFTTNQQSTTPSPPLLSSSPHILTRSAAQRYANATPPVVVVTTRSNSRISITSNSSSNHTNNGKIVKPSALRALSSSSSVSSLSTNLSANQAAKNALIASTLLEAHSTTCTTCQNIKPCKCINFSLIAKYFASFPANRLKQQSKSSPFAIPQSVKNKDAELCKHFNHIVKLSDTPPPPTPPPQAPAPLPPQSPPTLTTQLLTMPTNLASLTIQEPVTTTTTTTTPIIETDDGYNQITMETRSTRKFLIKYHPYLQNRYQTSSEQIDSKKQQQKLAVVIWN